MSHLLELPMWATVALDLTETNVYINPEDNSDYIAYVVASEFVSPISDTGEYGREVYEKAFPSTYTPGPPTFCLETPTEQQQPFKPVKRGRTASSEEVGLPKKKRKAAPHSDRMCKIAFINYFKGGPRDVLCRVYTPLRSHV